MGSFPLVIAGRSITIQGAHALVETQPDLNFAAPALPLRAARQLHVRALLGRIYAAHGIEVAYLLIGSIALGVYFVADIGTGSMAYLAISALPVVALVVGPALHRPRSVLPWLWLAAGQGAFLVGDVIWFSDPLSGRANFPSAADVAYLAAYPLLAMGLVLLIRGRRPTMRLAPIIDALVIAVVGALTVWIVYVDPWIFDQTMPVAVKVVMLAYPLGDVLLVALAVYLMLAGRAARLPAMLALAGACVLQLLGDTSYAGAARASPLQPSVPDALWLGSYLLIGLAALLPSMSSLSEPYVPGASRHRLWPKVFAGLALLTVPVFALMQQLLYQHFDVGAIVVTQLVMVAALLLRVHESGKSETAASQRYAIANDQLRRLGAAIEQASDAVVVTDAEARIEYVNPSFEQITGYSRAEVMGQNPRMLKGGQAKPRFYESMWNSLAAGKSFRADFVNRRKDGTLYRMVGVITPLLDDAGRLTGYVGVQRDVTRQRELEITAHRIARERSLVAEMIRGLDPRESPEKIAQSVCDQITKLDDVVMAGLFTFDADGHAMPYGFSVATGERAPRRRLAKARTAYLQERARQGPWIEAWQDRPNHPYNDLITRLGVRALAYTPVRDGPAVIGFMVVGSSVTKAEEQLSSVMPILIEAADLAGTMIQVKVAARGEVSAERGRFNQLIDRAAFHPVFQPLVDISNNHVVGYEALTRFDDGIAPDVRFTQAHAVGLGERLELAAIRAALAAAKPMPPELWLNLNASPAVVMDGGELQRLTTVSARDLVVEVTEHTEITDYPAFRRAVQQLGPRVRLAVDDAGAGFASLRHIIELRPSFVKLDRQVIAGIDRDEARQAMIAGLSHFAYNSGCWLIAEGVETVAELEMLRQLEVRYGQGYLLGRPAPYDELRLDGHRPVIRQQVRS